MKLKILNMAILRIRLYAFIKNPLNYPQRQKKDYIRILKWKYFELYKKLVYICRNFNVKNVHNLINIVHT